VRAAAGAADARLYGIGGGEATAAAELRAHVAGSILGAAARPSVCWREHVCSIGPRACGLTVRRIEEGGAGGRRTWLSSATA
jgi:hypothetical protein